MKTRILSVLPFLALLMLFAVSCTWQPRVYYPNAFERGTILDRGRTEIGAQLPFFNLSVAHGFLNSGLEARGSFGYANYGDMMAGGLSLGKSLVRAGGAAASVLAGGDYIFSISVVDPPFRAGRATGTIAFSYKFPEDGIRKVRIVLPVKFAQMFYDFDGREGRQFRVVPGLGTCFESRRWVTDIIFNLPLPLRSDSNEVITVPYFGVMISFRF